MQPVLRDLFLDLAIDRRIDEFFDIDRLSVASRRALRPCGHFLIQTAPPTSATFACSSSQASRAQLRISRERNSTPSPSRSLEPIATQREERILVQSTTNVFQFDEWLVEAFETCLEDLAGIGRRDAIHLDLVLGDAIPGGLRDDTIVAVGQQRLLHAGRDDEQVGSMIEERVQESDEGLQLLGVEVIDLVDAEDQGLMAIEGQTGECPQDLLGLLVVADHGRRGAFGLQAERSGDLGVDLVSREPGEGLGRQSSPRRIVGPFGASMPVELEQDLVGVATLGRLLEIVPVSLEALARVAGSRG